LNLILQNHKMALKDKIVQDLNPDVSKLTIFVSEKCEEIKKFLETRIQKNIETMMNNETKEFFTEKTESEQQKNEKQKNDNETKAKELHDKELLLEKREGDILYREMKLRIREDRTNLLMEKYNKLIDFIQREELNGREIKDVEINESAMKKVIKFDFSKDEKKDKKQSNNIEKDYGYDMADANDDPLMYE
jgi:hypothetical protein